MSSDLKVEKQPHEKKGRRIPGRVKSIYKDSEAEEQLEKRSFWLESSEL